ncbi:hypothetical protein KPH14_006625 [Odynerus spinipes]|uniref:LYR motif-containing protein 9 n=1 Tax=Odynerus spinipes TaxID=1348599 RepID=A0AAD9RQX1_9HYME|nr:hypothetical protein KPH14_006625 [Odynerus spinipes]
MASAVLQKAGINSSKQLYKFLLRECNKLPQGANEFYKHSIKQSFRQHVVEPDPERVKQIMEKAFTDAEWILKKYHKEIGK